MMAGTEKRSDGQEVIWARPLWQHSDEMIVIASDEKFANMAVEVGKRDRLSGLNPVLDA